MLGTKDLGIHLNWKYRFLNYGAQVHSEPGTIYIDLGNRLDHGVIDHHLKDTSYSSSLSAIINNPHLVLNHLLGPLNKNYYSGNPITCKELTFVFATHQFPDWDGIASYYLIDYLLKNGCLLPEKTLKALSIATDLIDQGLTKINGNVNRPFLLINILNYLGYTGEECLEKGKQLIEFIVDNEKEKISSESFLNVFSPPDTFQSVMDIIGNDYQIYLEDLNKTYQFKLSLPKTDQQLGEAKAIAFLDQPECKLHKFWAREMTDADLLIVPFSSGKEISRVIISVKPYENFILPCLGYELEKAETEKRKVLNKPRIGLPRFEKEYCDNSDPWYDGRGHNYTIVDSPNDGTVLEYSQIIEIVKKLYNNKVGYPITTKPLDAFISYRRDGGSDLAWAIKTMLTEKGFNIFLDVSSMGVGRFDKQLLERLSQSKNVIVILSPNSLDRALPTDDWFLLEIKEAIKLNKRIIPLIKPGFKMPENDMIPSEVSQIFKLHGIVISHEYFYASINQLIESMDA